MRNRPLQAGWRCFPFFRLLTLAHSNKIRDAFLQPRSCLMPIVVIILAVSLMAGVAIALSLLRSKRLADISSASLSSGLAHPRLALGVAFFCVDTQHLCSGQAAPLRFLARLRTTLFCLWLPRSVRCSTAPGYLQGPRLSGTNARGFGVVLSAF
jgi:hypothetical protein